MKKTELIFYSGTIIIALGAFLYAGTFPSDAAYFPKLISAFIILFSAVLLLRAIIKHRKISKEATEEDDAKKTSQKNSSVLPWRPALVSLLLIVYCLVFETVGFIIPTILLIGGIIFLFGSRKWVNIVLVSVITTVSLYVVFRFLLNVNFPSDSWFF